MSQTPKFCPNCGSEIAAGSTQEFCFSCDARLRPSSRLTKVSLTASVAGIVFSLALLLYFLSLLKVL
jgi:uncharacterized membrane protein YvbJ